MCCCSPRRWWRPSVWCLVAHYKYVMTLPVHVFYLCFSDQNPKLCKEFPKTMLYDRGGTWIATPAEIKMSADSTRNQPGVPQTTTPR